MQPASQPRPLSKDEIAGARQKNKATTRPAIPGTAPLADPRLDWKLLRALAFDPVRFQHDQQQIALGAKNEQTAMVRDTLAPIDDVEAVAYVGPRYEEMRALGEAALSRGEVAVVVLNGGMATRFGGVVKGVVDVFDDRSFIELKAQDVLRASYEYGAKIPFVLMNSFQTNDATNDHVLARGRFGLDADQILTFQQSISLRMNPDGSLFIGDDGQPSYHAPGHGDFFDAIKRSGVLAELEKRGVKTVLFSNVDNLGATIDPAIIGHHLAAGAEMTAELVEKRRTASGKWDAGASPALLNGRARIIEGFRLPPDLPVKEYPDFSTNNFLFSTAALKKPIELERFVVRKTVDDSPALQLESITCEASSELKLHLLRVPRDGEHGRFFPIKEPIDLEAMRPLVKARLAQSSPITPGLKALATDVATAVFERYGRQPEMLSFGPGRANLIGEHVDNFGGEKVPTKSIPFAIDRQIVLGGFRTDDRIIEIASLNLGSTISFSLDALSQPGFQLDEGWGRFVQAVAVELLERGHSLSGARGCLKGNIPGKGVSSSAALGGALVLGFSSLFGLDLSRDELVEISRAAERRTGVPCGYLDQMASVHGRPNGAVVVGFFGGKKPSCEAIPMDFGDARIAGIDTGRTRDLKTSQYGARMREALEVALPLFAKAIERGTGRKINALSEITAADFARFGKLETIGSKTAVKRVRHVVTEMARVEAVEKILKSEANDKAAQIGLILDACHVSLRDDFEVSCPELDFLVDTAKRHGAYGARLMGAGEGGNMILLAPADRLAAIVEATVAEYAVAFPERKTVSFDVAASTGTGMIPLSLAIKGP